MKPIASLSRERQLEDYILSKKSAATIKLSSSTTSASSFYYSMSESANIASRNGLSKRASSNKNSNSSFTTKKPTVKIHNDYRNPTSHISPTRNLNKINEYQNRIKQLEKELIDERCERADDNQFIECVKDAHPEVYYSIRPKTMAKSEKELERETKKERPETLSNNQKENAGPIMLYKDEVTEKSRLPLAPLSVLVSVGGNAENKYRRVDKIEAQTIDGDVELIEEEEEDSAIDDEKFGAAKAAKAEFDRVKVLTINAETVKICEEIIEEIVGSVIEISKAVEIARNWLTKADAQYSAATDKSEADEIEAAKADVIESAKRLAKIRPKGAKRADAIDLVRIVNTEAVEEGTVNAKIEHFGLLRVKAEKKEQAKKAELEQNRSKVLETLDAEGDVSVIGNNDFEVDDDENNERAEFFFEENTEWSDDDGNGMNSFIVSGSNDGSSSSDDSSSSSDSSSSIYDHNESEQPKKEKLDNEPIDENFVFVNSLENLARIFNDETTELQPTCVVLENFLTPDVKTNSLACVWKAEHRICLTLLQRGEVVAAIVGSFSKVVRKRVRFEIQGVMIRGDQRRQQLGTRLLLRLQVRAVEQAKRMNAKAITIGLPELGQCHFQQVSVNLLYLACGWTITRNHLQIEKDWLLKAQQQCCGIDGNLRAEHSAITSCEYEDIVKSWKEKLIQIECGTLNIIVGSVSVNMNLPIADATIVAVPRSLPRATTIPPALLPSGEGVNWKIVNSSLRSVESTRRLPTHAQCSVEDSTPGMKAFVDTSSHYRLYLARIGKHGSKIAMFKHSITGLWVDYFNTKGLFRAFIDRGNLQFEGIWKVVDDEGWFDDVDAAEVNELKVLPERAAQVAVFSDEDDGEYEDEDKWNSKSVVIEQSSSPEDDGIGDICGISSFHDSTSDGEEKTEEVYIEEEEEFNLMAL